MTQAVNHNIEVYRPTTTAGLIRISKMLVGGAVIGVAASFLIYLMLRWIGFYIPVLFPVIIAAAVFFGVIIGEGTERVVRRSVVWFIGTVAGCLSYLALLIFISLGIDASNLLSILVSASGAWEETFIGIDIPVAVRWAFDSAIIVGIAGFFGCSNIGAPYCIDCAKPCEHKLLFTTSNGQSRNVMDVLASQNYQGLIDLKADAPDERDRLEVMIHHCDYFSHDAYLTLTSVTPGNGDTDKNERELVKCAVVKDGAAASLVIDFAVVGLESPALGSARDDTDFKRESIALTELARQNVEVYRYRWGFSPSAHLAMLAVGSVAAVVSGLVAYVVSHIIGAFIPIVVPLVLGLAVGVGLEFAPWKWRVRSRWFRAFAAAAAGCLGYFTVLALIGLQLNSGDPLGSLLAEAGLTESFMWIVMPLWVRWSVELMLLVGFAVFLNQASSGGPGCEACNMSCDERLLFETSSEQAQGVIEALAGHDYERLKDMNVEVKDNKSKLKAQFYYCKSSAHQTYLTLSRITPVGETELVHLGVVQRGGAEVLNRDFPPKT